MMADERRLLDALERMRVHREPPSAELSMDATQLQRALDAALATDTPPRRKSSALSISHLAAATPEQRAAERDAARRLASQAVRDIARELDAVEARLSVYRQSRAALATEATERSRTETEPTDRPQQAGEVADEVEHTLANCDRLLQHAQLQATKASLTRSLRGSGASSAAKPPPSRSSSPMLRVEEPSAPTLGGSAVADDEMELEATAQTLRAMAVAHEDEIQREAETVMAQELQTRAAQLRELQRKYESKKKMVLVTLREQGEAETRAVVKQTIAELDREQQEAMERARQTLLQERARVLSEIVAKHRADTDDQVKRVRIKLETETHEKKQELEKRLQQETEQQLKQIAEDAETELQRWEQKKRLEMETEVLRRREQAATDILKAQEAKTSEMKRHIQAQQAERERDELEKLQKALAFGAQAQLQQLRKKLEADHEQRMVDTRTEAQQRLDDKLADLKRVLDLSHKQEVEQLRRNLEKRHRVAVMELHEQLERAHRAEIDGLRPKAQEELEMAQQHVREEAGKQHQSQRAALQETMERDQRVKLRQLEMEHQAECDEALQQLQQRLTDSNRRELENKLARLAQNKKVLLDEAVLFLSMRPQDRAAVRNGGPQTTETTLRLKHMSTQLPKELQRAVVALVDDYEELVDEQQVLVEKIGDATGLYLTFKRQCSQAEAEADEYRVAVQQLQSQLQVKDALAKKLYSANETLLNRLGLMQ